MNTRRNGNSKNPPHKNLNLNVRGIGKSATIAINEYARQLQGQGREVFRLGLGQSPFPVPESVVEELRRHAGEKDYLQTQGLRALRMAIARHYNECHSLKTTAANVMVGPGSKELMFILQLAYYGDLVIPTPSWVSYEPQARIIGRIVNFMPTAFEDGWRITPAHIREICTDDKTRPRILVLNYPGNPSGTTYSDSELKELAAAAKKYEVIILSDEIYGYLDFKGEYNSISRYYPEGTIVSTGLSKWCGAGGWRLGCFIFPNELGWMLDAMVAVASETYTSTSAPIQYAAVRAFKSSADIDDYRRHTRRILSALGRLCAEKLRRAGARVAEPQGGFYLFPDFSDMSDKMAAAGITTSKELCRRALDETGVAILPGSDFARPAGELTARIAYVDFNGARALEESRRIPPDNPLDDAFTNEFCRPALTGIERLCDWVDSFR